MPKATRGRLLINYWPTQFTVVTNRFGAAPAYYKQFNLPGHEGIDVRAQYRAYVSPIYSSTAGIVIFIGYRQPDDPYGYQVRIKTRHEGREYEIVYAHLANHSCQLALEQPVQAGTVIGKGGATGNAKGVHLHISIKRQNATRDEETSYPFDLINPEPLFREYIERVGLEVEWQ